MDVERGSGNVFADLGLPNAEEHQVKADIAIAIIKAIRDRGITQVEAGKILGLAQPKVSDLMRGKLGRFTVDRLLRYMKKLDHNVTIMIEPKAPNQQQAVTNVQASGFPIRDGDYLANANTAILTVNELSGRDKGTTAAEIAAKYELPTAYAAKIMSQLAKSQILRSARGPVGGFTLARPANKITLLAIIEAVHGQLGNTTLAALTKK